MTTSENATQKSTTFPTLSVHHESFLWALCHALVLSTPPTSSWPNMARACPSPRSPTPTQAPADARA
jgi:hypothetical protein